MLEVGRVATFTCLLLEGCPFAVCSESGEDGKVSSWEPLLHSFLGVWLEDPTLGLAFALEGLVI